MSVRVLALTGMPGSGKGVFSEVSNDFRLPLFKCGDIVREAAFEKGLEADAATLGRIMFELREAEGPAAVVKRMIPQIACTSNHVSMVEGIRSLAEVDELRTLFNVSVVAVHSSPPTRFKRLVARGRSDDPHTQDEFNQRDVRELKVGLGDVIALADTIIINEGSLENLRKQAKTLIECWMKDES